MSAERRALELLHKALTRNAYPCPICAQHGTVALINMRIESEVGDYGEVLTSWPVFDGTCADPPPDGFQRINHPQYERPLNHAEQLNREVDTEFPGWNVGWVMGQAHERKNIVAALSHLLRQS